MQDDLHIDDQQYLLSLTVRQRTHEIVVERADCCIDIFLQLCNIRSSFKCFLEETATVALAFPSDALVGYHDRKDETSMNFRNLTQSRRFKALFTTMVDF